MQRHLRRPLREHRQVRILDAPAVNYHMRCGRDVAVDGMGFPRATKIDLAPHFQRCQPVPRNRPNKRSIAYPMLTRQLRNLTCANTILANALKILVPAPGIEPGLPEGKGIFSLYVKMWIE